ncbi:MAG: hypothetical protein V4678_04805 [Patescibacteria group bacterium]
MKQLKQMNRKTLMIGGGVLAAAVILIVTLVTLSLTVWAQPSKQDFEAAKKAGEKIVTDYPGSVRLNAFFKAAVAEGRAGKTQDELVAAVADEKKAVVDTINSRRMIADTMAESRVLRDKETKKSFDTYYAREKSYDAYYLAYVDAFPRYYSSLVTCADIFQLTGKASDDKEFARLHNDASKDCLTDLNVLSKTSITPYANYANEFTRIVTERQKVFDAVAKDPLVAKVDGGAKIKALAADQAKNDPTDAVITFAKDASFDGELDTLIDLLDKKAKATN